MKITAKYRKFRKALLAKGYKESEIYHYYQEADHQGIFEPDVTETGRPNTAADLVEDFETFIKVTREMEAEDPQWSAVLKSAMDRALKEAKEAGS